MLTRGDFLVMKLNWNFFYKFSLALALAVGFIPNLGAIDKIAPQWFFLNSIGLIFLTVTLFNKQLDFSEIFKKKLFKILALLLIWIGSSYFYAINPIESLVVFSQYFSWLLLYLLFYTSLKSINRPFYFISIIMSLYLVVEIVMVLNPLLTIDLNQGIQYRSNLYLGTAANINITAFSLLYKIPFLLYFIDRIKMNTPLKVSIATLVISASFFIINTLLLTRSAILTTLLFSLLFIATGVYIRVVKKRVTRFSRIFILSLFISYGLNTLISKTYGGELSSVNRLQTIAKTFSVDKTQRDGSISQRLNFYSEAITQIKANPILGVGIGNWKIKSIDADKENIVGYRVPYHVHNDFLELATETGIIGAGLYVLIIIFSLSFVLKLLKRNLLNQFHENEFLLAICAFSFFIAFLIDSMLNFPIARPIEIIVFILMISYISLIQDKDAIN